MDSGEMAIESANYLYAVIFAAGAYITYRWFWAEAVEQQKQFNFKPMDAGPVQAPRFFFLTFYDLDFYDL